MYPHAKGHMLEVWATLECPVCGDEMRASSDDTETDDVHGELYLDTYACDHCEILVTYISPKKYGEYHDTPDSKKWYQIEDML